MKAWEVVAVQNDGELVCPGCYTDEEREVADDIAEHDDISPVFASDIEDVEYCGRCGNGI